MLFFQYKNDTTIKTFTLNEGSLDCLNVKAVSNLPIIDNATFASTKFLIDIDSDLLHIESGLNFKKGFKAYFQKQNKIFIL